ncbi:DUF2846 domain-containing protein [Larkinella punicea]|uniref:DUF2846 domain-containing protein n=1 Tax=Larkinella punicea TaxID=2315727 RepID=A0A368JGF0_9BACT|nr:DUF2846 domain-containing protein [Larkinella punicea]RCR65613.1 DUF2846 domain-containing protein [Larkinella punicea]
MKNFNCILFVTCFLFIFSFPVFSLSKIQNNTLSTFQRSDTSTSKYALIYLYRPFEFWGLTIGFSVKKNGTKIFKIRNNSVHIIKVFQSGVTTISAQTFEKKSKVNLKIELGKAYYLKCTIRPGFLIGHPKLRIVSAEKGKIECYEIENDQ